MHTSVPLVPPPPSSAVPACPGPDAGAEAGDAVDALAVRAWARSRGYPIDESGGIPLSVLRTYRRLHLG